MKEETGLQERQHGSPAAAHGPAFGTEAGGQVTSVFEHMGSYVGELGRTASAQACIGQPSSEGGHTVVPLATVSLQSGFAMGFGGGSGGEGDAQGSGGGGGGGGGGRASSRVVAVVHLSPSGVSIRPVLDVTSLALGLMALAGVAILARKGGKAGPLLAAVRQQ